MSEPTSGANARQDTIARLEGELTIQHAAEQRTHLLGVLEECSGPLQLDLSAIEACDSSGIQLMLATRKSLADRGQPFSLSAASPAVTQVLAIYGLQSLLAQPA